MRYDSNWKNSILIIIALILGRIAAFSQAAPNTNAIQIISGQKPPLIRIREVYTNAPNSAVTITNYVIEIDPSLGAPELWTNWAKLNEFNDQKGADHLTLWGQPITNQVFTLSCNGQTQTWRPETLKTTNASYNILRHESRKQVQGTNGPAWELSPAVDLVVTNK